MQANLASAAAAMSSVEEERLNTDEDRRKMQAKGYSCHNTGGKIIQPFGKWSNERMERGWSGR